MKGEGKYVGAESGSRRNQAQQLLKATRSSGHARMVRAYQPHDPKGQRIGRGNAGFLAARSVWLAHSTATPPMPGAVLVDLPAAGRVNNDVSADRKGHIIAKLAHSAHQVPAAGMNMLSMP